MAIRLWGGGNRVRIDYGQGVTTATIYSRGTIMSAIVTLFFLGFWTFGGLFAGAMLAVELKRGGSGAFLMIWLAIWVLAEFFGFAALLWQLFGRTVVSASNAGVKISRKVFFFGLTSHLPALSISRFSFVLDDPSLSVKVNGRRIPQSALRVHTADRTYSMGRGIGRDDADAIIKAFQQRIVRSRVAA